MDLEEIPEYRRYKHEATCEICDMKNTILTQGDGGEETSIYLLCICGNYIKFILPVN